jgi:DNA-binding transcriptional LysR family regulator
MEIRQLRYFEAVCRHRHFTRAADELHVAQSALSHQIGQLERELGTRLLNRTTRSVALTEAGELVAARARSILIEVGAIRDDIEALEGLVQGRLAIGALVFGGELDIPAVIVEFTRQHPGIELELREGTAGLMAEMVLAGSLDLAFALEPETRPTGLESVPLSSEELVVVMAPDHALAECQAVSVSDLASQDLIMFTPTSSTRTEVDHAFTRAGLVPRIALEVNDLALTRSLVSRGLSLAVLPRTFADLAGPPVVVRSLSPELRMPVVLWSRSGRPQSSAARAFAEFAQAAVAVRPRAVPPARPASQLRPAAQVRPAAQNRHRARP